ncbi:MAG: radical SAM protein [Acetobacteraceae bacterium]
MPCRIALPSVLTQEEVSAWQPGAWSPPGSSALGRARERMARTGQWGPAQLLGRRWSIGCVALEVTQRCNLDCTLCYLSEMSEAVHDLPLPELFRRIDAIAATYGPGIGVQITGGDPTLRRRTDLVAIIQRVRARGLRPTLFTNGIKASRSLLAELAAAGLRDVAFHVDTTQLRKGYATEVELNAVREEYIARASGLPLTVFFNTTVHAGNFGEIPDVARFFVRRAEAVRVASFQLQADTGRGIQQGRPATISRETVAGQIAVGAGAPVRFLSGIGHHACNLYAVTLVAGGRVHAMTDDPALVAEALTATSGLPFDYTGKLRLFGRLMSHGLRHPGFLLRGGVWSARLLLWQMRNGLLAGRAHRLGFFIHDFMDASHLRRDRVEACAFMVATEDGPVSMCLHNAKRDSFILKPIHMETASEERLWDPLLGDTSQPRHHIPIKGRVRRSEAGKRRPPNTRAAQL